MIRGFLRLEWVGLFVRKVNKLSVQGDKIHMGFMGEIFGEVLKMEVFHTVLRHFFRCIDQEIS